MITFTESDVRRLDPLRVIAAIEDAFRDRYTSTTIPVRTQIAVAGGVLLVMPCYDRVRSAFGMKLLKVRTNPTCREDRVQATYLLLDPETGRPTASISANYLTDLRTAATSAVATKLLARDEVQTLGIFGTGSEARAHLKILPLVRNFQRVLICGRNMDRSREFVEGAAAEIATPMEPADPQTCTTESDVICTCTNSPTPLFEGRLIRPGTHLNVIGAFQPDAREVDSITVKRAQVVVEVRDAVFAEAGDLMIPISEGVISAEHVLADLHEVLSSKKSVRCSSSDITLFKSVGCALEDLVTAELLISS
jgi:ornithine cyclodeaminase/alanine dehydrogenase-like protein (mu-crystallin family)